jgi:eukaryotic-like serine/threonine-protein kinase
MSLREGETLGPYEIVEPIGKGGMGEVYRARDPRMGRDVAIKISAEHFSERFTREVHAIASLNHPNVCTLHDVGPDYLVMELVDGPTLADRIVEGPIPLEEALPIARQICDALEAAHDKGIVHRDLKPGNIKLRSDGTVKVLDFGLAKMGAGVTTLSDESPTLSMQATQAGVILGTAAYMAPEQARGKAIDKRADIWAFGVVLHEMVTGRRLFQGEDLTDTIAAVVREKADVSDAPMPLRRVLERCLEKDPRKRLRDISGVALLLESARLEEPVVTPSTHAPRPSRLLWIAAGTALVAAAGLAALAFVHFREQPPALHPIQFALEPPSDTGYTNPYGGHAVSPDGRYIVFTAGKDAVSGPSSRLWLRPMESLSARVLPGTEGGNFPTWSPDSKSLVFSVNGQMKRIELSGGSPLMLATIPQASVTPTGTWNRDGVLLVGSGEGLWRVAASGGNAILLTKIDKTKKESGHGYPQFLADGNRFLYFVESADPGVQGVYASSLDHPDARKQIVRTSAKAAYVPPRDGYPAYLLWLREQSLLAQRFDAGTLEREGEPTLVADDIGLNPGNPVRASFWASEEGTLIYFASPPSQKRPLVWMSRDGKPLGDAAPEDAFQMPAIAPDGRIAFSRIVEQGAGRGNQDIWIWDPTRQTMTRLTFDAFQDVMPVWSPDGRRLAFGSVRETGESQVFVREASGAGSEVRLSQSNALQTPLDWSRDGRYLLIRERGGTPASSSSYDLVALPLDTSQKPIPLVHSSFNESMGRISPDGAWLAYRSDETGQPEFYIQAFPTPGANGRPLGKWQVSNSGASDLKWRDDGRELYYEAPDGKIMAVEIDVDASRVRIGTPRELFSGNSDVAGLHSFDATGDGMRFLILQAPRTGAAGGLHLNVLSNWQASLKR